MAPLPKATKRRDVIRRLRELGWTGPHKGHGKHPEFMAKGTQVLKLPNPHAGKDIGVTLLKILLEQGGISADQWLGEPPEDPV